MFQLNKIIKLNNKNIRLIHSTNLLLGGGRPGGKPSENNFLFLTYF